MLKTLQHFLKKNKIDGWLQNRSDIFLNEYDRPEDNLLAPLTGFTGSAGLALVLSQKNFLLVDGRYDTQAKAEVDKNWEVMGPADMRAKNMRGLSDFLLSYKKQHTKKLGKKFIIGFHAHVFSYQEIITWQKSLTAAGITLKPFATSPLKPVLKSSATADAASPTLFDHDDKYSGQRRDEKLSAIQTILKEKNIDGMFIGDNANLSWLLNLRANIIPFNPVVTGFCFVSKNQCHVFLSDEWLAQKFDKKNITLHAIDDLAHFIKQLPANKKIALDPDGCSYHVVHGFKRQEKIFMPDPITRLKSIKNKTEVDGARQAHLQDGIAMVRFLYWLEQAIKNNQVVDEENIASMLWHFRQQNKYCVAPSFSTISALSGNAALPHYQTNPTTNRPLSPRDILLLDSGAHYFFGTTDITRTLPLSPRALTDNPWGGDFARHYVAVLRGNLALARAQFPAGVSGAGLDPLARQFLWQMGLDYNHGTGHGIGSFLPVHEGPQYISGRSNEPMCAGMITSNEPGFYKTENNKGVYGIRIENVELCIEVAKEEKNKTALLGFETLTLCPIDTTALHHENNLSLLSHQEKEQLNHYHAKVARLLSPHLSGNEKNWLLEKTKPI